jgi:FHS family Na+ dependent glucose MFS transporter 1
VATVTLPLPSTSNQSRIRISRTIAYYLLFICVGMANASLGPTLPGLASQTASTLSAISAIFALRSLGRMVGTYLAGERYDRLPSHPIIVTAGIFITFTMFAVSLTPFLWLICLFFFAMGSAEGFVDVGVNASLVWTQRENTTPYINGLHLFFGLGAFLIPIVSAYIVSLTTYDSVSMYFTQFNFLTVIHIPTNVQWVYRFIGLAFLPLLFVIYRLPSPKPPSEDSEDERSERKILPKPTFKVVGLFALLFLLYVGAESSFGGWIYTYAITRNLATPAQASFLASLFWLMVMFGRVIVIMLSRRLLPRHILTFTLIIAIVGLILMIAIPSSVWLGTIIVGLGLSPIFPTALAFANHNIDLSAKVTSYFYMGGGVGVIIIPWLIGQMIEPIGAVAFLWVILVAVVLAVGIIRWLIREIG